MKLNPHFQQCGCVYAGICSDLAFLAERETSGQMTEAEKGMIESHQVLCNAQFLHDYCSLRPPHIFRPMLDPQQKGIIGKV